MIVRFELRALTKEVFTHNSFWLAGFLNLSYKVYIIENLLVPSARNPGGEVGLKDCMEDTSDDKAVIILWDGGGIRSNLSIVIEFDQTPLGNLTSKDTLPFDQGADR